MAELSVPFARLAELELVPVPGQLETRRWRAAWSANGISFVDRNESTSIELDATMPFSLQLSRSMRLVEPGWLMRSLGHEIVEEHRLHVEVRTLIGPRVRLSAVVERAEVLEDLPALDAEIHDVPHGDLADLVVTALALGARIAHASAADDEPAPLPMAFEPAAFDSSGSVAWGRPNAPAPAPAPAQTPADLRRERDALRERVKALESDNLRQHTRIRELETDTARGELAAAHARIDELEREYAALRVKCEQLERVHAEQIDALTGRLQIVTGQHRELDDARKVLAERLAARDTERDQLLEQLETVQRTLSERATRLTVAQSEVATTRADLEVRAEELERERERCQHLEQELRDLEHAWADKCASVERARDAQRVELEAANAQLRVELEAANAQLRVELDAAAARYRDLELAHERLGVELEEARYTRSVTNLTSIHAHNAARQDLDRRHLQRVEALCDVCRTEGVDERMAIASGAARHGQLAVSMVFCPRCGYTAVSLDNAAGPPLRNLRVIRRQPRFAR